MDNSPEINNQGTNPETPSAKKKTRSFLSFLAAGIKKLPAKHTLRLTPAEDTFLGKTFPLAVDFGTTAVKMLQLGLIEDELQIINLFVEEIPLELWNNPLRRKQVAHEAFKKIIKQHKIKGEVVSSLPSSAVEMKAIKLPPMPEEEILPAVKWELKQTSTIDLEDMSFDYYILGDYDPDVHKEIEIMVTSCQKKDILDQIEMIKSAGLIPLAVEMDSLAAVSTLIYNGQINKDSVALLLELGCHSCSINIVMNNQVYFKRDLDISGHLLTQGIEKQCSVVYEEAERLKHKFGLINPDGSSQGFQITGHESAILVNETLWLHMEDLIQDIDYTFKYFIHQFTAGEVRKFDQIILSGGTANLEHFSYYLNNYLGVPVNTVEPLRKIHLSPEVASSFPSLGKLPPRLAVSIGLGLREVKE